MTAKLTPEQTAEIDHALRTADISGLDVIEGLGRFNNSATLYVRVLRSFIDNMPELLDELATVSEETLADYAIKVHGSKGSCYGISANACGDAAKALEMASKAGDLATVLRDNGAYILSVRELIAALSKLVLQIDEITAESAQAQTKLAAPDTMKLRKLLIAAQGYDIGTMQEIVDDLSSHEYEQGGELIVELKSQMAAFAYDRIVERLEQVINAS
jgi:HPt (histidine-containing phosphotransfer) domain-containing protein